MFDFSRNENNSYFGKGGCGGVWQQSGSSGGAEAALASSKQFRLLRFSLKNEFSCKTFGKAPPKDP
jgi:hypothetical protein